MKLLCHSQFIVSTLFLKPTLLRYLQVLFAAFAGKEIALFKSLLNLLMQRRGQNEEEDRFGAESSQEENSHRTEELFRALLLLH